MSTKRKETVAISSRGVNYVRTLVEAQNCIFQKIDLENDQGNDAYIEFVRDEQSTGCLIAAQIKSGASYISEDGSTFFLKSDRSHFEYWAACSLPVVGIVFNPQTQVAAWCNVTAFLAANPGNIVRGPYTIPIFSSQVLSPQTFSAFTEHFLSYQATYRSDQSFGRTLELFSNKSDIRGCQDALWSLFSFHRQRVATWYYLISCLRQFSNHVLLGRIVEQLSLIKGHGDVFWSKTNIIRDDVAEAALSFMEHSLCKEDFITLLGCVHECGFSRGTIGQCVHVIIDVSKRRNELLKSIAFDSSIPDDTRHAALVLLVFHTGQSKEAALEFVDEFIKTCPGANSAGDIDLMRQGVTENSWGDFH
jgi:hypothetical protein